ncbi:MAG: tRNA uridine-5-carboxymethylaminomethyl(34) synthesis GTPase MnmE [Chitinophagaceae bacterium]|nr:tRNA uridine-5-carboxymethylaminomethyl(34) synthesis GTPase MnmE [Chitinophagaceae bacterium]
MHPNDTIVAIATAPGMGAIGIVRLSGAGAFTVANAVFRGKDLSAQPGHTLHFGHIVSHKGLALEQVIDEVVAGLYKGPKSYTGEDTVEFSGHGSPFVLEQIVRCCIASGARLALPGEFTQRAFLNGKMDLTQAEAVADLIAADSAAAQQTALKQLKGGFSSDLKVLREQLIQFAALIELELDFSQEDVAFADRTELAALIARIASATQQLIQSFSLGNAIKNGVSVAIIGKPNAGKSTLLNALLNEDRAIVSDIAGTTRDTIEELLNIKGILFRLIDTAGIREHTSDEIEQIGVGKSLEKMRNADVVIGLFDASTESREAVLQQEETFSALGLKYLLVLNKTDLPGETSSRERFAGIDALYISARQRGQLDALKEALYAMAIDTSLSAESTVVTNARHHEALLKVAECLEDIRMAMDNEVSGELLALDIRRCLHYLGTITGQVEVDRDILGTIFGKFCIGK